MSAYWNNLRPFEKRVVVGIGVATFVVFNMWFVIPHFGDWKKIQYRMDAAQKKLKLYQATTNEVPELAKKVKEWESEGLSVPQEDQSVDFLRTINNEAIKSKVQLPIVGTEQRDTNRPFFVEISRQVSTLSGESELVDFLYNLGAGNSLIRVRALNLRPDAQHQQLNGGVTLVASYQKKPPPKPTSPPPPAKTTTPTAKPPVPANTNKASAKTPPAAPPASKTTTNKPTTINPKKT